MAPRATQDSLPAAGPLYGTGLVTRRILPKGFRVASYISSPFPRLGLAQGHSWILSTSMAQHFLPQDGRNVHPTSVASSRQWTGAQTGAICGGREVSTDMIGPVGWEATIPAG